MPYSNFVILIPKKTSLAHRASDGQNPLARSENLVAPDYRTRICMKCMKFTTGNLWESKRTWLRPYSPRGDKELSQKDVVDK